MIGIFIFTYNTADNLNIILSEIENFLHDPNIQFYFIDNNSNDNTKNQLFTIKNKYENIKIIINEKNYNFGGSYKIILKNFYSKHKYILTLHSNLRTNLSSLIAESMKTIKREEFDICYGSRFNCKSDISKYSPLRRFGYFFFNKLVRIFISNDLEDFGSSINLFNTSYPINKINLDVLSNELTFPVEFNFSIISSKPKIKNIPLIWKEGSKSNVNLLNFTFKLFKIIFIYSLYLKLGIDRRKHLVKNKYKKLEFKFHE